MSKYDEMVEAARASRQNWVAKQQRAFQNIGEFVGSFAEYCSIPPDRIHFMPWDEQEQVFRRSGDRIYGVASAHYFEEKDAWGIGITIVFGSSNQILNERVSAGLYISEEADKVFVGFGGGKPRQFDFDDEKRRSEFYEEVVEKIKQAFREPRSEISKQIGFSISS